MEELSRQIVARRGPGLPSATRRRRGPVTLRERGVALITALLVMALVAVAAAAMASRQELDIRRTGNLIDADQAYLYAVGAEGWAGQLLRRDHNQNKIDTLGDIWAKQLPPIPVEGGQIAGHIADLQGRFNLNNLVDANGRVDPVALARFQRLLRQNELNPNLADAVIDWIDPNQQPTPPAGAEDGIYLSRTPPYRAANRPFTSPSELMLVQGFTPKMYHALAPDITALPTHTPINVNTAPAAVLRILGDGISADQAKALVTARGDKGFASVQAFLSQGPLAGKVSKDGLSVSSDYFLVSADARIGNSRVRLESVLARNAAGQTRTLERVLGPY